MTAGSPEERGPSRRARRATIAALVATGLVSSSVLLPGIASAAVPVFPDNIVVFPNRDMVVLEGFDNRDGQDVTIEVHRSGTLMGAANGKIVAGGEFEVNHPGGACWGNGPGQPQVTPDIQKGDVVSVKFAEGGTTFVAADSTVQDGFVDDVDGVHYTDGATTFTVTGHIDPSITPDRVEQRIVNPDLVDTAVARRDIRAVVNGTLTPAPKGGYSSDLVINGDRFTATYDFALSGDAAADVARIAANSGGERVLTWVETDAAGNRQGITIAERGEPGGPGMGGCPAGPTGVGAPQGTFAVVRNAGTAQVTWTPATAAPGAAAVTGYSVEAIAKTAGTGGTKAVLGTRTPADATRATLTVPGAAADYDIEVRSLAGPALSAPFTAAAGGGTGPGDPIDNEGPAVTANRNDATGAVTLTSEAGADIFFTTGATESPVIEGTGFLSDQATLYTAPVTVAVGQTLRFVAFDQAGNVGDVQTLEGSAPTPPAATAPGTPAGVTVVAGTTAGTANVTWTAPANNGGADITRYDVAVTPAPSGTQAAPADPKATSRTITGLTNGTTYSVTVTATNSVGTSDPSPAANYRAGDTVTIGTARWKAGDFRVTGTGTLNNATITVHRVNVDGTAGAAITGAIGPVTANAYSIRVRGGAPATNPGRIIVKSSGGGQTAPFTVANG